MALINDDVLPSNALQICLILHDVLVSGNKHMEFLILDLSGQLLSITLLSFVDDDLDVGSPLVELHLPV